MSDEAGVLARARGGNPGLLAGVLGCVFGILGIFTAAQVLVPLAAACCLVGLVRGAIGLSAAGIALSLVGAFLVVAGVVSAPGPWPALGDLVGAVRAPARAPEAAALVAPAPPPSAPAVIAATVAPADAASDFAAGQADRAAWDGWFDDLHGSRRAGAEYWTIQRGAAKPGSCTNFAMPPEWQDACAEARSRLALPDAKLRSEPDYRRGWDGEAAEVALAEPPPAAPATADPATAAGKETRAQDAAWEQEMRDGACARVAANRAGSADDIAACKRHYAETPRCVSLRNFASNWFDKPDDHRLNWLAVEKQAIAALGKPKSGADPAYYRSAQYRDMLRHLLGVVFSAGRSKWSDREAFGDDAYEACMAGRPL
jgi:hypothetical protein